MGRGWMLLALASGLPGLASANTFESEYPDNGARALGRAGAFAVRADDPSAIYYNPAGLTRQRGFGILLSANLVALEHGFEASDDIVSRKPRDLGSVSQREGLSPAPMIAASFRFDALPDFALARASTARRASSGASLATRFRSMESAPRPPPTTTR